MTALEQLYAARDLLTDPARWTQGVFARDKFGTPVNFDDPNATAWCVLGALYSLKGGAIYPARLFLAEALVLEPWEVSNHNDTITHWALLKWLDRAIALAEQQDHDAA